MSILESARLALLDPHLDAAPADLALMRSAEVAVFEEQIRADERNRVASTTARADLERLKRQKKRRTMPITFEEPDNFEDTVICDVCGALVYDASVHHTWHRDTEKA